MNREVASVVMVVSKCAGTPREADRLSANTREPSCCAHEEGTKTARHLCAATPSSLPTLPTHIPKHVISGCVQNSVTGWRATQYDVAPPETLLPGRVREPSLSPPETTVPEGELPSFPGSERPRTTMMRSEPRACSQPVASAQCQKSFADDIIFSGGRRTRPHLHNKITSDIVSQSVALARV